VHPASGQAEARRAVLVRRLAYVVREHRAMTKAMGDIGSPDPVADINANINNSMHVGGIKACQVVRRFVSGWQPSTGWR
jgi:hypothetical protein